MRINYAQLSDAPELKQLCAECNYDKCTGICLAFRRKYREINGLPPLKSNARRLYHGNVMSVEEGARRAGVSKVTIYARMNDGMTFEQAVDAGRSRTKRKYAKLDYHGVLMSTYEVAAFYDLNPSMLYSRLRRGMSIDEAVESAMAKRTKASEAQNEIR